MKKIAILQSNYIPWKGYFDIINMVDEFIIFDDVQFTKNDWRNRNKIKTSGGLKWITVPVLHNSLDQKISDTKVAGMHWQKKHWNSILMNYSRSKYFSEYRDIFEDLYCNVHYDYLSNINLKFILVINEILGIKTKIRSSNEFKLLGGQTERLIDVCKQCSADIYLSGPSAKNYLDEQLIREEKLLLEWVDYSGYLSYNQLFGDFEHEVTILDLIFNEGSNAIQFMKSFSHGC